MSRSKFEKTFNTFTKGLITEASELNFPEDSSLYEKNFVLYRDGGRDRRRGMELIYPLGLTLTSLPYPQFTGGSAGASIGVSRSDLIPLVKRAEVPPDSMKSSIAFPRAELRPTLWECVLEDKVLSTIEFPQAALRSSRREYVSRTDAVEPGIEFPQARLRLALLRNDYEADAVSPTIQFSEAQMYEPN